MVASAQGIDVSAFQQPLTAAALDGLDFAYCKATEGLTITDPNLRANWAALRAWGKPRGVYHEFVPADSPAQQAAFCYAAVQAAGGFQQGDMAAVVASDYAGTTGPQIAAWCATMRSLAGARVAVLVYSDLNVLPGLAAAAAWPLWVAWPSPVAPEGAQLGPWAAAGWTFWQWGIRGTDRDAFNGTAASLAAWQDTYKRAAAPPPGPGWTEAAVQQLPELGQGATGPFVRRIQGLCLADGRTIAVDGIFGPLTKTAVEALQAAAGITVDGIVGQQTWPALLGLQA